MRIEYTVQSVNKSRHGVQVILELNDFTQSRKDRRLVLLTSVKGFQFPFLSSGDTLYLEREDAQPKT